MSQPKLKRKQVLSLIPNAITHNDFVNIINSLNKQEGLKQNSIVIIRTKNRDFALTKFIVEFSKERNEFVLDLSFLDCK